MIDDGKLKGIMVNDRLSGHGNVDAEIRSDMSPDARDKASQIDRVFIMQSLI
jgi:hypothetical protein